MKKVKIVITAITVIIILAIFILVITNNKGTNNYKLEKIGKYSYFKLYENEKYGVIDDKGNILINPTYSVINIPNPTKAVFICYYDYNEETEEYATKVLDDKNVEILTDFEQVLPLTCKITNSNIPFEKSVLKYKENGKYGLIDFEGKRITKAIYDEIESLEYREGCLKVKQNDKYGIININAREIIKPKYDDIKSDQYYSTNNQYMDAGFITEVKTEEGYRFGYISKNGKELVKPEYNDISRILEIESVNDIYLLFGKNGRYGILKNSQTILSNEYEQIEYNKDNNVFIVQKNVKQGVFSAEGNQVLPIEYDNIVCEGKKIIASKGESIDTYNNKGELQDSKFDNTTQTSNENYLITKIDDKFGVISKNGQTLIESEYENLEYAFSTYFIATQNGKVGVLDINNGKIVEFEYDIIQKIKGKNVLEAIISDTNTIEIYNYTMEKQASMQNAVLYTFDNYIKLLSENDMQYVDNNGNAISNKEIMKTNKLFAYTQDGKWGFVDSNNTIVVETKYDLVTELNQYGFAGIKQNNKWGVIDAAGKIIVDPSYKIDWNEPDFIGKYCKTNFGYGYEYYTDKLTK